MNDHWGPRRPNPKELAQLIADYERDFQCRVFTILFALSVRVGVIAPSVIAIQLLFFGKPCADDVAGPLALVLIVNGIMSFACAISAGRRLQ